MRKQILAATLVLMSAAQASAQALQVRWHWVVPEGESFAVLMPEPPLRVRRVLPFSQQLSLTPPSWEVGHRGVLYTVISFERSKGVASFGKLDSFVEGFRHALVSSPTSADGSLTFDRDLNLRNGAARQYQLRVGSTEGTARIYETANRFYVLMTLGARSGEPRAEHFFNSFIPFLGDSARPSELVTVDLLTSPPAPAPAPLWPVAGSKVLVGNRDATGPASSETGATKVPDVESTKPSKVIIQGGVLNGKAISKPQPPYPPIARAARAQGTVTVQITVDEEGYVISASAVSGHPLLQAAGVQAARQARFSPTRLQGMPVKVSGIITYNFVLQ